jgi:hypothetical protein
MIDYLQTNRRMENNPAERFKIPSPLRGPRREGEFVSVQIN